VGWTSYDPFTDTLAPAAAAPSASASDSETPTKSGAWGVYDPVAGRIVMQSASSNSGNDDEEVDKAEEQKGKRTRSGGKGRAGSSAVAATPSSTDSDSYDEEADGEEKGKRTQSGGMVQDSWSAIAVPRKAAGKAGKQRGSYVCSGCGKAQSQWWGICPHCEAVGTLNKFVHGADPGSTGGSHHAVRSWIPQKSKEMVPQSLHDVNKGFDQAEWRIPL
jgi:DNA repair protein RadA/Sms